MSPLQPWYSITMGSWYSLYWRRGAWRRPSVKFRFNINENIWIDSWRNFITKSFHNMHGWMEWVSTIQPFQLSLFSQPLTLIVLGGRIPLYQHIRGWYRLRTRQVPPWSTGAPFLKPGPNFRVQISNFSDFLGVLRVRLDLDMCSHTHLGPMDHSQPLLDLIFIIF